VRRDCSEIEVVEPSANRVIDESLGRVVVMDFTSHPIEHGAPHPIRNSPSSFTVNFDDAGHEAHSARSGA
jgi:hypothetical protein